MENPPIDIFVENSNNLSSNCYNFNSLMTRKQQEILNNFKNNALSWIIIRLYFSNLWWHTTSKGVLD